LGAKLLKDDPEARVVIMFHGNAGHIAQAHRPQIFRSLCLSNEHLHVIAIDYRGFGHSTGDPSEAGLVLDGITIVNFVLSLGIPPERIVILGQSLGTAVSSAVALHFSNQEASIALLPESVREDETMLAYFRATPNNADFAAVVLVASFPSLPELLLTYRMAGLLPVLSPLRFYPNLQSLVQDFIVDKWTTAKRLAALVEGAANREDGKLNLKLMHALDDRDIPWKNGEMNWESASGALEKSVGDKDAVVREEEDFGREGFKRSLEFDRRVGVMFETVKYGGKSIPLSFNSQIKHGSEVAALTARSGHNEVVASVPATLAVLKGFGFA
jgi:abhydrolase domain-containing protein 12